jgi:excinuclease ABC subunit A
LTTATLQAQGVKTHNLKNISVNIPIGQWTTVTGVSGSGKSSLVFDTIYAESQRRFLETIGTYERQFLQGLPEPDVQHMENIPASVALKQNNKSGDPRSVIATAADILEPLRSIFAALMDTSCSKCGSKVETSSAKNLIEYLKEQKSNTSSTFGHAIFAPILNYPKNVSNFLSTALAEGYTRIATQEKKESFEVKQIESLLQEKKYPKEKFEILLDVLFSDSDVSELENKIETVWSQIRFSPEYNSICVRQISKESTSENLVFKNLPQYFNVQPYCKNCASATSTIQSGDLDWQSALGACQVCNGIGNVPVIDKLRVIPDPNIPILKGGIKPWSTNSFGYLSDSLEKEFKQVGLKPSLTWNLADDETREWLWGGSQETSSRFAKVKKHTSVLDFFAEIEKEKYKHTSRIFLAKYRKYIQCNACEGSRLSATGRNAQCGNVKFETLIHQPIQETLNWVLDVKNKKNYQNKILTLRETFGEVERKLTILCELGLGCNALTRRCKSLSGGEYQRVLLTRVVGNGLSDALYILDEPSVGLGKSEIPNLIKIIQKLKSHGNTVLMVEHDVSLIEHSDNIIELGPVGGYAGGYIVKKNHPPISSVFNLNFLPPKRKKIKQGTRIKNAIGIKNFNFLHCQGISVQFPLSRLSVVSGPSGSGKSTLLMCGLSAALEAYNDYQKLSHLEVNIDDKIGSWAELEVPDGFLSEYQTIVVDQKPLHRSVASVPATLLGLMDALRKNFGSLEESARRSLSPSDFGFNGTGGCPACGGKGTVEDDLFFLGSVEKTCPECNGERYKPKVLKVMWHGKTIAQWMQTSLLEAQQTLGSVASFRKPLDLAVKLGIGHLSLGTATTSLSGGEAQRLKICSALNKSNKKLVCLLDEPTRGLSEVDVASLLQTFINLAKLGHTFICVEHHPKFIEYSQYLVELGPESGVNGGKIINTESE